MGEVPSAAAAVEVSQLEKLTFMALRTDISSGGGSELALYLVSEYHQNIDNTKRSYQWWAPKSSEH